MSSFFVRQSKPRPVDIRDPKLSQKVQVKKQVTTTASTALHPNANNSPNLESGDYATNDGIKRAFNIYARPYVPQALINVNKLGGPVLNTPLMRAVDFGSCVRDYIGINLLPTPINLPSAPALNLTDDNIRTSYEHYFRYHLGAEVQPQHEENESYSLYEHEVSIISTEPGYLECSFEVPGLRENSSYIEEDDTI